MFHLVLQHFTYGILDLLILRGRTVGALKRSHVFKARILEVLLMATTSSTDAEAAV